MFAIKKIIIPFLIISILTSGFFLFPKKATAAYPVEEIGNNLYQNIIQAIKNTLIANFTQISSLKDIWQKMHTLLSEQIRASVQKLLEQQLQTMTNDILSYIKDNDLIIKNFNQYYTEQTQQKTKELLQTTAKETNNYSAAPKEFQSIYQSILNPQNPRSDSNEYFNKAITCNIPTEKEIKTWDDWQAYWDNPACNVFGATLLALDKKAQPETTAETTAMLQMMSPGVKAKMEEMAAGQAEQTQMEQAQGTTGMGMGIGMMEEITTPVSAVEEMMNMASTNSYKQAQDKNSALVNSLGTIVPYIQNLLTSFLNQIINQGMSAAMNALQGPSSSQPNAPMPPNVAANPEEIYDTWAEQDLSAANSLLDQQKLFNENLTNQYLFQQQVSLDVLLQIQDLQKQALLILKDIYFGSQITPTGWSSRCDLPAWAEKTGSGDTIKITVGLVGSITFNKNKETIETIYQVAPRIDSMRKEIVSTQQTIVDLNLAVSATENFISVLKIYIGQPTDQTKTNALSARDSCLKLGQKPINSLADTLFQLDADTQEFNLNIVQKTYDIESNRGYAEAQTGLYAEISGLNSKVSTLNQLFQTCPKK